MLHPVGLALLAASLLVPVGVDARTWVVHPDGSGDASTIMAAIDSVTGNDVIELVDGTYTGPGNRDLDNQEKEIFIYSQSGDPTLCVIDCQGSADDPHTGIAFLGGG
jgi:hypothetical protein